MVVESDFINKKLQQARFMLKKPGNYHSYGK